MVANPEDVIKKFYSRIDLKHITLNAEIEVLQNIPKSFKLGNCKDKDIDIDVKYDL